MDYYTIAGMVVAALIAYAGAYKSIRKESENDRKPIEDLNISITKLNANFQHMLENDDVRDKRLQKHGTEIDRLKEKQIINEKLLNEHEIRLGFLEDKKDE